MTKHKLLALTLATFALTAVVSGGATFAVLSDSHVVTANLGAGNVNVNVASNTTEESACDRIGDTTHSGNASENPEDVSIVLEPTDQSIGVNGSTKYDVIVKGADRNISGYTLHFALCDDDVATFENFTHEHSVSPQPGGPEVTQDRIEVSAGTSDEIAGTGSRTVLGTITVTGNSSGSTSLGIVDVGSTQNVQYAEENDIKYYNITSTSTSTVEVKVNESENGS